MRPPPSNSPLQPLSLTWTREPKRLEGGGTQIRELAIAFTPLEFTVPLCDCAEKTGIFAGTTDAKCSSKTFCRLVCKPAKTLSTN